jgi:hypothetical protein
MGMAQAQHQAHTLSASSPSSGLVDPLLLRQMVIQVVDQLRDDLRAGLELADLRVLVGGVLGWEGKKDTETERRRVSDR